MSSTIENLDIQELRLPCRRKTPKMYDDGLAEGDFHDDVKVHYCQYYFEAIGLAVNSIKNRFNQPGYQIYQDDIHPQLLHAQLLTFRLEFKHFYEEKYGSMDGVKLTIFDINHL